MLIINFALMQDGCLFDMVAAKAEAYLNTLTMFPDLRPSPKVDLCFGGLVKLAQMPLVAAAADKVIETLAENGALQHLHRLCAHGEGELERHWAARLEMADDVARELRNFPYLEEYRMLVQEEVRMLGGAPKRVLFVGSGPLPLTAYLMARDHGMVVDMVDIDTEAHNCAMGWLEKLPESGMLECLHGDVRELDIQMEAYDGIIVAALAGFETLEKQGIIDHLAGSMAKGQRLLLRSADGLRRLLYPQIGMGMLQRFNVVEIWRPDVEAPSTVINSVIALTKN